MVLIIIQTRGGQNVYIIYISVRHFFFMTASRFHQLRLNVPFINVLVGIYLKNPAKMLLAATPLQTLA